MIKEATLEDLNSICSLCSQSGLTYSKGKDSGFEYYEWFKELLSETSELFYVYVKNNKIVGFICGERLRCKGSILWFIAVTPELHNKGIGVRLLKYYEEQCKNLDITWLYSEGYVNTILPNVAKRLGYITSNKLYRGYYKEL